MKKNKSEHEIFAEELMKIKIKVLNTLAKELDKKNIAILYNEKTKLKKGDLVIGLDDFLKDCYKEYTELTIESMKEQKTLC